MAAKVDRPGLRAGYDRWAATYDTTPNPLVALDRRYTPGLLAPRRGERILDAACGTGVYLGTILAAGGRAIGLDLSRGMLRTTRRKFRDAAVAQADLNESLPVDRAAFDAVVCALVGEHLTDLRRVFREFFRSLAAGGRLVFSVFHPEMAAAGIEANFEHQGVEYRLGAERHGVADYVDAIERCGFRALTIHEFRGDAPLVDAIPWAAKYLDRPLLLTLVAEAPG